MALVASRVGGAANTGDKIPWPTHRWKQTTPANVGLDENILASLDRETGGAVDTGGGLYLKEVDLAKIGYLYLNDGIWDGQRLISETWVRQSLTPAIDTGKQGVKYGFKWRLKPLEDRTEDVWLATGFGGQRLIVFPSEQLIATFTGWNQSDPPNAVELANRLLPAVRSARCAS